jgi:hypothetical protein
VSDWPQGITRDFLDATEQQARRVLEADEDWATYRAGSALSDLASQEMSSTAGEHLADGPVAVYLVWSALTDAMDAPGTPDDVTPAVRRMKQAAAEWVEAVRTPATVVAYLDHWKYEECGYDRNSG